VTYRIVVDELVLKKDFRKIGLEDQRKIIRAIRQRLATRPKDYGEPLRGELKGFWKLRVGQFRVIYEIHEDQVVVSVIMVGFRRDEEVYRAALGRLGLE
jgi:mRNA interferase RelE/StbE